MFCTHQGFQSGGKGATIPSRAMNRRSFSLIGSIPIDCAYSNISAKKNSRMHDLLDLTEGRNNKIWVLEKHFVTYKSNIPKHTIYDKVSTARKKQQRELLHAQALSLKNFCITKGMRCFSQVVYQDSSLYISSFIIMSAR